MSQDVQRLQEEFPDLSESVIDGALHACDQNASKTASVLRVIKEQENTEKQQRISELKDLFPEIPENEIIEELNVARGNVDTAIVPLFNRSEALKQQRELSERRQKKREEEKRRKREAKNKAKRLMRIFNTIPKDTIQQILDENEGDIEETTNQLLILVSKQEEEEEAKKRTKAISVLPSTALVNTSKNSPSDDQEQQIKTLKIQSLCEKFDILSEQEVIQALSENSWDIKKTLIPLMMLSEERKKSKLKLLFSSLTDENIRTALVCNDWNLSKAAEALTTLSQKKKEEEEEREIQKEILQKESEKREQTRQEASCDVVVKKISQAILDRSIIWGDQIEEDVKNQHNKQAKENEKAARALFKDDLEKIIGIQARNGVSPGLNPPPLPKQIDAMLGKPRPVEETNHSKAPTLTTINTTTDNNNTSSNTTTTTTTSSSPSITNSDVLVSGKNVPILLPTREVSKSMEPPVLEGNDQYSIDSTLKASLSATPTNPDIGNPVQVEWHILSANCKSNANDWVGLFAVNETNRRYITYQWTGKDKTSGTLSFLGPNQYGTYEFRYFPGGSYQFVAVSNRIKVGPKVEMTASLIGDEHKLAVKYRQISGNEYSRAWIGLYEISQADNRQYLAWEYAPRDNSDGEHSILFDCPVKPKRYEFRYFTNSYEDVARSNPVTVEGSDAMTASLANGIVTVNLNIVTIDPYYESAWVGLYFVHEKDNRSWRRYRFVQNRTGAIQFKAPRTAGIYEARLFANKTYDIILRSNQFEIQ